MRRIDYTEYFSNIVIPQDWSNLDEFIDWFLANRMPIMVPLKSKVIVTDNATAVTIFRHRRYQVELYIMHPKTTIVEHSHPGIDLAIMQIGNSNNLDAWGVITSELKSGNYHGGDNPDPFNSGTGYLFLTFERWEEHLNMTSAAIQWEGKTHGPVQDALIKAHKSTLEKII